VKDEPPTPAGGSLGWPGGQPGQATPCWERRAPSA